MGLRREDIDDIDIALTGPAVLNLFNVCDQSVGLTEIQLVWSMRTRDVFVQYRIFLDHIVNQAPRRAVEDQYFPLEYKVRMGEDDGRA